MSTAVMVICKGCGGAIVSPGPRITFTGMLGEYHVSCAAAASSDWARADERKAIAAKAREYASHYPPSSDGMNTFVILAEWIENR